MSSLLSRRRLLEGALAIGGAAVGARLGGPLIRPAHAATETSHVVHVFLNGGLNALFAGCADKFVTSGIFGVTNSNIKSVGNGVFTDAETFGTFPDFALAHWAAIGMRHGNALHTLPENLNSGGERAILRNGDDCYLNQLASYMGGGAAFKSVYFGDRPPAYQEQPAFQGVSLQRVSDIGDAVRILGAEPPADGVPERANASAALAAARKMSARSFQKNPARLSGLKNAFGTATDVLKISPAESISFADVNQAYGLDGATSVGSYASMFAGAEIMIRAGNTNVVNITDFGAVPWDFHQVGDFQESRNGSMSRDKFIGNRGGFGEGRLNPIRTFLSRMLNLPNRNVVVAITGDMVRLPNGDHGDGTVGILIGKYVKQGISFPVDDKARFSDQTPGVRAFWAAVAAAARVSGTPFGANPHPLVA